MNTSELLDQFIVEARECLEQIGKRLLDVERTPGDTEMLNDLFRQVHTLKGNCGLFEFKALERVVHAGEDVLDRVRNGTLPYSPGIADALLAAMDYTAELVDAIAESGRLPDSADARSRSLADALRVHLNPAAAAPAAATPGANPPAAPASAPAPAAPAAVPVPAWCAAVPAAWQRPGVVALRYRPEPQCFFKGEDPWHLARQTPGLQHLAVGAQAPWPAAEAFDCYACNLELLVVSDAPQAYVEEHFRYVPEQVEMHAFAAAPAAAAGTGAVPGAAGTTENVDDGTGAAAVMQQRLQRLWQDQCTLLARPAIGPGTVAAVREAMLRLARVMQPPLDAAAQQALQAAAPNAQALLAWAEGRRVEAPVALPPGTAPSGLTPFDARRPGTPGGGNDEAHASQRVLKVSQDKIDRLMDLIGEMVVAKNALPYLALRAEEVFQQRELAREIKTQYSVINRIAEDMQHAIMQVRMLPVGTVFQRFVRLVRDISKKLGKEVQLVIEGEDTEADKNVIESLADPLIHILRNSLDHGIEAPAARLAAGKPAMGTLRVTACQEGDRVIIDISDDGAGIDTERVRAKAVERGLIPADRAGALTEHEAVQLVFLPGFSTADAISDLSGRGVGMDVVRSAVERINGSVELRSQRGQGTRIRLTLPLSMAVTNVMMIECAGRRFGVPMDLIVETVRVPAEDIHRFKRAQTVVLRGRVVPLQALAELLELGQPPRLNTDGEHAVLVVRLGGETVGLLVDDFHGTSDIILKPLEGVLAGLVGFAGTALMGDGSVLMILNPKELA
ncbi:hypothetical protein IP87_13720 [beta proteobacterium AAP121]|nr:hypothetical protein IP80_17995 [beta proteobacterium AAP65]KPF96598.1 hypothetical protein IP87_13720 [beta proteobacterium AAP121]